MTAISRKAVALPCIVSGAPIGPLRDTLAAAAEALVGRGWEDGLVVETSAVSVRVVSQAARCVLVRGLDHPEISLQLYAFAEPRQDVEPVELVTGYLEGVCLGVAVGSGEALEMEDGLLMAAAKLAAACLAAGHTPVVGTAVSSGSLGLARFSMRSDRGMRKAPKSLEDMLAENAPAYDHLTIESGGFVNRNVGVERVTEANVSEGGLESLARDIPTAVIEDVKAAFASKRPRRKRPRAL